MIPGTLLGQRMGLRSVLPGLSAAAGCLLIFIYGATLLSALPAGLFVAVISYLGLDLLITWLWIRRRQFSLTDYLLVLLILVVAATVGFFEALGIGILAAAAMFIVSFARVNVVRLRSTLASRRSLVERSDAEVHYLMQTGHQAAVFELSGFLFFGTANALVERVQRRTVAPECAALRGDRLRARSRPRCLGGLFPGQAVAALRRGRRQAHLQRAAAISGSALPRVRRQQRTGPCSPTRLTTPCSRSRPNFCRPGRTQPLTRPPGCSTISWRSARGPSSPTSSGA